MMVEVEVLELETGQARWLDMPAIPRVGEGVFFGPEERGGLNRKTVKDVTYKQAVNGQWEVGITVSSGPAVGLAGGLGKGNGG